MLKSCIYPLLNKQLLHNKAHLTKPQKPQIIIILVHYLPFYTKKGNYFARSYRLRRRIGTRSFSSNSRWRERSAGALRSRTRTSMLCDIYTKPTFYHPLVWNWKFPSAKPTMNRYTYFHLLGNGNRGMAKVRLTKPGFRLWRLELL